MGAEAVLIRQLGEVAMKDFRRLDVWKKAHSLTLEIYRLTATFPTTERYGLTSQLQRAAASIGANLAEGCGRESDADYRRLVQIASGSACEVEYQLLLARDLGLMDESVYGQFDRSINEIKRMLVGLSRHLNIETSPQGPRPR
jgi:four helix bundle protein